MIQVRLEIAIYQEHVEKRMFPRGRPAGNVRETFTMPLPWNVLHSTAQLDLDGIGTGQRSLSDVVK